MCKKKLTIDTKLAVIATTTTGKVTLPLALIQPSKNAKIFGYAFSISFEFNRTICRYYYRRRRRQSFCCYRQRRRST